MKTTKIQIEAEIFDDAEYCNLGEKSECYYLDNFHNVCRMHSNRGNPVFLKYNSWRTYEKCDQCKEAWKKAKYPRPELKEFLEYDFDKDKEEFEQRVDSMGKILGDKAKEEEETIESLEGLGPQ